MGAVCSYVASAVSRLWVKRCRVVMLGLDGAGKTTMLHRIHAGETVETIPTNGLNFETFVYKNIEFTLCDLSGQSRQRALWQYHSHRCDAVIFVVDATDRSRMDEAVHELHRALKFEELREAVVLVFANKQELPDCMHINELFDRFKLDGVSTMWNIQKTSAATGEGVDEGMDWLSRAIRQR